MAKRTRRKAPPQARPVLIFGNTPEALPLIIRDLEIYRRRHRRGDGTAVLLAIELCAVSHVAPPNWAAEAFFHALSDWLAYRAATLDAAFGVDRSGEHIEQSREREALRPAIMLRIAQLHQQGNKPIDAGMFALIGNEVGKSASYVSKVYYDRASAGWRKILRKLRVS